MIYLIGAFAVIIPNIGNIIPSFLSIFSNAFPAQPLQAGSSEHHLRMHSTGV